MAFDWGLDELSQVKGLKATPYIIGEVIELFRRLQRLSEAFYCHSEILFSPLIIVIRPFKSERIDPGSYSQFIHIIDYQFHVLFLKPHL